MGKHSGKKIMQHLLLIKNLGVLGIGSLVELDKSESDHISKVLRMKKDDEISISDLDGNKFITVIDSLDDNVVLKVVKPDQVDRELNIRIDLFQGIPKSDKLETVIQKSVELGVAKVTPVDMQRSVAKIDDKKKAKKLERLQTIADNASNQSKRQKRTLVNEVIKVKEISIGEYDIFIVPYEMENTNSMKSLNLINIEKLGILVGPEGGISDEEVEYLKQYNNVVFVSLGKRILRTETAGLCALSYIMLNNEI